MIEFTELSYAEIQIKAKTISNLEQLLMVFCK